MAKTPRRRFTQDWLARGLQEKLDYRNEHAPQRTRFDARSPTKRRTPTGSVSLTPMADDYTAVGSPLQFELTPNSVHQGQIEKIKQDTGLDPSLQRALAECSLDRQVALLLYCCYRVSYLLNSPAMANQIICDYIRDIVIPRLTPAPANAGAAWTQARLPYRINYRRMKKAVVERSDLVDNAAQTCIEEFIRFLEAHWGA